MTATIERPSTSAPSEPPVVSPARRRARSFALPVLLVGWVVAAVLLHGRDTLAIGRADLNGFQTWINDLRDSFDSARGNSFFLDTVVGGLSDAINAIVVFFQELISTAPAGRPVPEIGWLGVLAILMLLGYAVAGVRPAILIGLSVLSFGLFGLWQDSMDLLIITFVSVLICTLIGIPVGIAMARSRSLDTALTPLLDLMQTLPSFAYLLPLVLFFGIGPAAAVVTTIIYALPPLVRITAYAIREVSPTTLEATRSLGSTTMQSLRKVELPMARRTIVVGLNQCTMAALSMATIAALIDGPGLGGPVLQALQTLDIGAAFVAGLLIVVLAIMLDRTTTAASERAEVQARAGHANSHRRRLTLLALTVVTGVCVYLSRYRLDLAEFPAGLDIRRPTADLVSSLTETVVNAIGEVTDGLKNVVTSVLINPLQSLLAESPWWLTAAVILGIAFLLGGWRPALVALACEAVILGTGLWNDSMQTLSMTLVATLLVIVLAMVLGVWMGRSGRIDTAVRPFLDALQTIPPFVYLVPALALFGPTRFTAIVAAVAYGVPIATKLVADGIRSVSPTSVEAAQASGTTSWQMITKVQLPMARRGLVLAGNQGLLYVLSMVVIGGLVGGGALGYLVVAGFSQGQLFGKGLAAGIAITALGVMLDRIAKHAAARHGRA